MPLPICIDITGYICDSCTEPELGRISSVAFVKAGIPVTNPDSNQTWVNIICPTFGPYGVIIPKVRGTYDGGVPTEGPGYGRLVNRRMSANHAVQFMLPYDCALVDFFNEINYSSEFELWYSNGSKLWRSGSNVHVSAIAPITDDPTSTNEFTVDVKWTNKNMSVCYDVPKIFESCETRDFYLNCLTCEEITIPCI